MLSLLLLLLITSYGHEAKALSSLCYNGCPQGTGKNWIWHSCIRTCTRLWHANAMNQTVTLSLMSDEETIMLQYHLTIPQASSNLTTLMDTSCPWAAHCRCRSCPQKDRSRARERCTVIEKRWGRDEIWGMWKKKGKGDKKCFLY